MAKIRNAALDDAQGIFELEKRVWGKTGATLEMIKSRLEVFPEGAYVAVSNENIIGVVFFELIKSKNNFKTWYDYTDNGLIKKSHDSQGDKIFGIDLSVSEEYSGKGVGTSLLLKVAEYSIVHDLKGGILGGRMPFYYKYKDMDPVAYSKLRDSAGKLVDPELRFYTRAGLVIKKLIPDYFEDPFSNDYGVLLEWSNPFYGTRGQIVRNFYSWLFKLGFRLNLMVSK